MNVGGHENYIQAIAITQDGSRVATGGLDKTITHFNAHTGQEIYKLGDHTGYISSVCYSPDGKYLLSTAGENKALMWRVQDQTLVQEFNCPGRIHSAVFSKDGKQVAMAYDRHAVLWDVESGEPVQEFISEE